MKLFFVRHGETAFNKQKRIMGKRDDEPLDPDGITTSQLLAERLVREYSHIFSSPLKRAKQTAQIINEKLQLPIDFRDELMERDFGSLSGKTWEEIQAETRKDLAKIDQELTYDYRPYGGESVQDVTERLQKFIGSLGQEFADKEVLIVSHTGIIELMYKLYKHETFPPIKNDSIHEFEI